MENATVETYNLYASNGQYIRQATRVRFADGRVVSFIEKLSGRNALAQASLCVANGEGAPKDLPTWLADLGCERAPRVPQLRGHAAMLAFLRGATLYVQNPQHGWVTVGTSEQQDHIRACINLGIEKGPKSTYGDYPVRYSAYAYGALETLGRFGLPEDEVTQVDVKVA